ncbi:MAG: hypothetical protein C5B46_00730 [Proteobacteria bacterium]|nr:MAG: hypothetical protein C5B46_00730 [Pseudomonadota bacterium]
MLLDAARTNGKLPNKEMSMRSNLALILLVFAANSLAEDTHVKEGPCKEIEEACQKAGFVKGEAKEGYGLWVDCIDPIMRGTAQPANAKKPLPSVRADWISACKAKHPNFGQGHSKK